ncbi:hypothetical protein [Aquibacillus kalidii]|uniref:hypothetical protein n=1 Tax=Aquibacillus kalidii TaxID=2762597 RepID=UPI001648C585|nr:hypothetical protein [Aquibacillus kalidii]
MENTASIGIGDVYFQSLDSQVKNNLVAGQTYGDFDYNFIQPVGTPLFDPDGADTFMPMTTSLLGLKGLIKRLHCCLEK